MKEVRPDRADDCSNQIHLQIELALDICPTKQIYTPCPRWDSLSDVRDSYWEEDDQPTQQQNSCDILDQHVVSCGNFSLNPHEPFAVSTITPPPAHQQDTYVGEQLFIGDHFSPTFAHEQCASVREQVSDTTNSDISESNVREQVKHYTQKSAHEHETPAHWVEKYWVSRANNKYWYYRYTWMSGRKMHRSHIGSVLSRIAQQKVEWVKEAIEQGMSPCEIKEWLIAKKISPLAGDM